MKKREKKVIKNNLRTIREEQGVTIDNLSDFSTVSRTTIHKIETDNLSPNLTDVYRISAILGCDVADIWPDTTKVTEKEVNVVIKKKVRRIAA